MKKTILPLLLPCIMVFVCIASCQKTYNRTSDGTNTLPEVNIDQLFAELRSTPQTYMVTTGRDTTVYGEQGTAMHFYANSFKDASGNIITSGAVKVELTEMYKPGDMIRNRATTTTTDDKILQSGGEINIVATMNGKEVFANSYGLAFKQNAPSSQPMELYYGSIDNSDAILKWTIADGSGFIAATLDSTMHQDSAGIGIVGYYQNRRNHRPNGTPADSTTCTNRGCFYIFDTCKHFHQINCDHFAGTPASQLTGVSVVLPDNSFITMGSSTQRNTELFLVLPSINASIPFDIYRASASNTVGLSSGNKIPIGWNYEIAVVANKNGQFYYWQTSGLSTSGLTVNAVMAPVTSDYIKTQLSGL